jgi:cobalt/nickel transport system permease protein
MLPIHLVIGIIEGIVTAAVLCFIYKMRPEIIESSWSSARLGGVSTKRVLVALAALTVIVGCGLALFASADPDGLEWAIGKTTQQALGEGRELEVEGGVFDSAARVQDNTAILPDYAFSSDPENPAGTPVSGIVGAGVTFALAGATGVIIAKVKKRKKAETEAEAKAEDEAKVEAETKAEDEVEAEVDVETEVETEVEEANA